MKTLFFDCTNGISGDMMLKALMELSGQRESIEEALRNENLGDHVHNHSHDHHACRHHHGHEAHHHHGRSWHQVKSIINNSSFSDEAKAIAISIYQNIAEAEAQVHGETLETIHFHEVGRDEAIRNALGIGMALETIKPDEILTSPIYDGKGTIICSHGEISVPVPAVRALMQKCSYDFRTADVDTEMVTPSGLAGLMGIRAKPSEKTLRQLLGIPAGRSSVEPGMGIIAQTEAKGSRDTGRDGLRVYLIQLDGIPTDKQ